MADLTTVLLADANIAAQRGALASRLGDGFVFRVPPAFNEASLLDAARDVEVIVGSRVPNGVLKAAERIALLQLWIAGVDHLDFALLRERRILVAAAHENARTVAELALALILDCARGVTLGDRRLRHGDWSVSWVNKAAPRSAAFGKTVGILGFGAIGRAFAALGAGLGFRLLAVKRHPEPDLRTRFGLDFLGMLSDLDWVLKEADYVLVALPKTPETIGLLNADHLRRMKPTAWLIQVGRSEVVEEDALFRACKEGWIAGAGIDVWYQYPPPAPRLPSRFPFHELDNVVMTPHCAAWTREALEAQVIFVADNLLRFRAGQPLQGLVDLDLAY
jgi:phosphoglycerate dehydrogenase-like enzyme